MEEGQPDDTQQEAGAVKVSEGDRLRFPGRRVGMPDRVGQVLEVLGADGEPPYLVQFEDGHRGEVFPGSDCRVESRASREPEHA